MIVEQCRAARALLGWSAQRLANEAQVGVATVRRYEGGAQIAASSAEALLQAMQQAGIVFIDQGEHSPSGGEGVRVASPLRTQSQRTE